MLNLDLFSEDEPLLKVNKPKKNYTLDMNKNLLIGFVKADNTDYFLDGGQTKLYYTGKTKSFPSQSLSINFITSCHISKVKE